MGLRDISILSPSCLCSTATMMTYIWEICFIVLPFEVKLCDTTSFLTIRSYEKESGVYPVLIPKDLVDSSLICRLKI
jgi:hypothetical protein